MGKERLTWNGNDSETVHFWLFRPCQCFLFSANTTGPTMDVIGWIDSQKDIWIRPDAVLHAGTHKKVNGQTG